MAPLRLTPLVRAVLLTCVALFFLDLLLIGSAGFGLVSFFALIPARVVLNGELWRLFTYSFFHSDLTHLLLNGLMWVWMGSELEALWGRKRFGFFALSSALAGGLFHLVLTLFLGDSGVRQPMVGLSGVIYGLLAAYGILFSERTMLFLMIFPMKAKHFVWLLGAIELVRSVTSPQGGVASAAHLGGLVGGGAWLWVSAQSSRRNRPSASEKRPFFTRGAGSTAKKRKNHLRLVVGGDASESDRDQPKGPTYH